MLNDGEHSNDKILGCVRCGSCCRVGGFLVAKMRRPKSKRIGSNDFTCRYFHEPNVCGIYESRPVQCRASKQKRKTIEMQVEICKYLRTTKKPDMREVFKIIQKEDEKKCPKN